MFRAQCKILALDLNVDGENLKCHNSIFDNHERIETNMFMQEEDSLPQFRMN